LLSLLLLLLLLLLHALLVLDWARAVRVLDLVLGTVCNTCSSVSLSAALACRTDAYTAACGCTASTPVSHNPSPHPLHAVLEGAALWAPRPIIVLHCLKLV